MKIVKLNKPIFNFPDNHPAKRFLLHFIKCRKNCVGREITYSTNPEPGIDQIWFSHSEDRNMTFSGFAYEYISFDIKLDGWIYNVQEFTPDETYWRNTKIPKMEKLLGECEVAARLSNNDKILELIELVKELIMLWKDCISERGKKIRDTQ